MKRTTVNRSVSIETSATDGLGISPDRLAKLHSRPVSDIHQFVNISKHDMFKNVKSIA